MDTANNQPLIRQAHYTFDPKTSVHEMLNDATEWLQCAQGMTDLLANWCTSRIS